MKSDVYQKKVEKENNDEKAYDEFKYSNNAEKIEIINKINNILSKCIDGKYRLSYDCCYAFDSIYDAIANIPEEAIRKAYEWCKSNNLL